MIPPFPKRETPSASLTVDPNQTLPELSADTAPSHLEQGPLTWFSGATPASGRKTVTDPSFASKRVAPPVGSPGAPTSGTWLSQATGFGSEVICRAIPVTLFEAA